MDRKEFTPWRHIFLYAKYRYHRTDPVEDLRRLVAEETGVPVEYIGHRDVIRVLCDLCLPVLISSGNSDRIIRIILELFEKVYYGNTLTTLDFIAVLLPILMNQRVLGGAGEVLLNLGEPDPSILPV